MGRATVNGLLTIPGSSSSPRLAENYSCLQWVKIVSFWPKPTTSFTGVVRLKLENRWASGSGVFTAGLRLSSQRRWRPSTIQGRTERLPCLDRCCCSHYRGLHSSRRDKSRKSGHKVSATVYQEFTWVPFPPTLLLDRRRHDSLSLANQRSSFVVHHPRMDLHVARKPFRPPPRPPLSLCPVPPTGIVGPRPWSDEMMLFLGLSFHLTGLTSQTEEGPMSPGLRSIYPKSSTGAIVHRHRKRGTRREWGGVVLRDSC